MKPPVKIEMVYEGLRAQLLNGSIAPGSMLPQETELAKSFGVARGTLRQALERLEAEGMIHRIPGKGTFAGSREPQRIVTFLLPCPSFAPIGPSSVLVLTRQMQGVIAEAQQQNFRVETVAVSLTNKPDEIDFRALNHLNADSMVIVPGVWYEHVFEFLSLRGCRVCLDHEQSEGIIKRKKLMKNWIQLENDVAGAVDAGIEALCRKNCRSIVYYSYTDGESDYTAKRRFLELMGRKALICEEKTFHKGTLAAFHKQHPFDGILTNMDWDNQEDYFDSDPFGDVPGRPPVFAISPPERQIQYSDDFQGAVFSRVKLGRDAMKLLADKENTGRIDLRPAEIFTSKRKEG